MPILNIVIVPYVLCPCLRKEVHRLREETALPCSALAQLGKATTTNNSLLPWQRHPHECAQRISMD